MAPFRLMITGPPGLCNVPVVDAPTPFVDYELIAVESACPEQDIQLDSHWLSSHCGGVFIQGPLLPRGE